MLRGLQVLLFTVGADLATPVEVTSDARVQTEHTDSLEREIDRMQAVMPVLRHFILPTGTSCAAAIHVARGLCRRAERDIVAMPAEAVRAETLAFVNRLSDYLFILARYQNFLAGREEEIWEPGK